MPLSYSWTLITPSPTLVAPPPATVAIDEDSGSGYSIIRKHFNRFFSGPNWDAIIAALGEADDYIFELCRNVLAQFTESTATGPGLDVLGNNQAIKRPWATGMTDDTYRKLLVSLNHNKVTYQSVLEVLEALYGLDNLRAYADSSAGPWSLVDGQSITFNFGGDETHTFWVTAEQFPTLGSVGALELGVALADWFSLLGLSVPIAHNGSQLRFYSTARGVKSTLTIGGTANIGVTAGVHRFAGHVKAIQPADGRFVITVPAVAPSDRTDGDSTVGGSALSVSSLSRIGGTIFVETTAPHGLATGDLIEISRFTPALERAYSTPATATAASASQTKTTSDVPTANPSQNLAIAISLPSGGLLAGGASGAYSVRFGVTSSVLASSPNHADQSVLATVSESTAAMTGGMSHHWGAGSALTGPLAGHALVTGGEAVPGDGIGISYAQKFDGVSWARVADTNHTHRKHFQVTLSDGEVLVGGGDSVLCERYNPVANFWYDVGPLNRLRSTPQAVLLSNGKVLVVGGASENTCELFDPATNTWTYTGCLSYCWWPYFSSYNDRLFATNDGAIFVPSGNRPIEVYTASSGQWRAVMRNVPDISTSVMLGDNIVCFSNTNTVFEVNTTAWKRRSIRPINSGVERSVLLIADGFVIGAGDDDPNSITVVTGNNSVQLSRGVNGTHTVGTVTGATTFTVPAQDVTFTAMHSSVSASVTRAGSAVTVSASIPTGTTHVWINSSDPNFSSGLKAVSAQTLTSFSYTEAGAAVTGSVAYGTALSAPVLTKPVEDAASSGFVVGTSAATASTALTTEAKKIVSDILSPHMDLEWVSTTPGTQGLGHGDENWR